MYLFAPSTGIFTNTLLSCSAIGFDINDGDLIFGFEWFNGEVPIASGATLSWNLFWFNPMMWLAVR